MSAMPESDEHCAGRIVSRRPSLLARATLATKAICRRHPHLLLFALTGAAVSVLAGWCMLFVDVPLSVWIANRDMEWYRGNLFVQSFRQLGKIHLILWLLVLWGWLTRRSRSVLLGMLAMLALAPAILPIKLVTQRYRPVSMYQIVKFDQRQFCVRPGRLAFPSGDTATVFAVATVLTAASGFSLGWGGGYFLIAAGVGALRIVSLNHFLSDVLVGAFVGVLAGYAALRYGTLLLARDMQWLDGFLRKYAVWILVCYPVFVSLLENFNPIFIFLKGFGVVLLPVVASLHRSHRHDRLIPV